MHQTHAIQAIEYVIVELKHRYATMIPVITTALLIESCYSSFYQFHSLIKKSALTAFLNL